MGSFCVRVDFLNSFWLLSEDRSYKGESTDGEVAPAVGGLEGVRFAAESGAAHALELFDVVGAGGTGQRAQRHELRDAGARVDEGVGQHLLQVGALGRVQVKDFGDEVAGLLGDGHVVGERVDVGPDLLVGRLHVRSLEGRFADDQGVDDHAEGPDVHLVAVADLALQDFRGDIVRRAADRLLLFALELDARGQAEVAQLDLHLLV